MSQLVGSLRYNVPPFGFSVLWLSFYYPHPQHPVEVDCYWQAGSGSDLFLGTARIGGDEHPDLPAIQGSLLPFFVLSFGIFHLLIWP